MNFGRPKRRPDPGWIDLTAMVDVVFQLVLFFMVSYRVGQDERAGAIDVELPPASSEALPAEAGQLELAIDADGAVWIGPTPVDEAGLDEALALAFARSPGTLVVVRAHTAVDHGRVVAVMDRATQAGLRRLAIATETPGL
jgi:biopolymer transport protein ExbD